jgi:ParB-like chromosome segregation protein Spo0J
VAGHGRVEASKILGLDQVPTIRLESLTPSQIRAYVIADNRLGLEAGWDADILKIELQHLMLDDEIDISLTGFESGEIDLLLLEPDSAKGEETLHLDEKPIVSRLDDLWLLPVAARDGVCVR